MSEQDIGALVYVGVVVAIFCGAFVYAGWLQEKPFGYMKERYVWLMMICGPIWPFLLVVGIPLFAASHVFRWLGRTAYRRLRRHKQKRAAGKEMGS